jgi:tetratricopeptide (TPR) repeat protein
LLCLPLVYVVTLRLWRYFRTADVTDTPWAAAVVTALFALHPALIESVVWISGRKYMLPNLFAMLTLWLAVKAKREYCLSVPHAIAALLAFVAMMLSKASYVAVAPIIALLWVMFWRDIPATKRPHSLLLWPVAILVLAGILIRVFIVGSEETEPFYFGSEALTRTFAILGWLARLAVSPEGRHFYYPVFEDTYLFFRVGLGITVLVAATGGVVLLLRKRSLEGFAMVAFVLLCMPYMQLIPYAAPSLVSDRFLALGVWAAILLIVSLAWRLNPLPRTALLLVIACSWAYQTIQRPDDWRSFETLIDADFRAYPGYYMPSVYQITNFQLPRGMYREATQTADRITTPEVRDIMHDMIKIHHGGDADAVSTGKLQDAMGLLWRLGQNIKQRPAQGKWNLPINNLWERMPFLLAIEWKYLADNFPDDVSVRYNAGLWMLEMQRYDDAIDYLRTATGSESLPKTLRGIALKSLGVALIKTGHIAEAEAPLQAALKQTPPELSAHCKLGDIYEQTGRFEEAVRARADCPA